MSDQSLTIQRGTTGVIRLTVKLNNSPFDVSVSGSTIVATFKRRRIDQLPLFTKVYDANGTDTVGAELASGSTNLVDVTIDPADTAAFQATEFLVWDAILTEPEGRQTPIAKGALTVRMGVGS